MRPPRWRACATTLTRAAAPATTFQRRRRCRDHLSPLLVATWLWRGLRVGRGPEPRRDEGKVGVHGVARRRGLGIALRGGTAWPGCCHGPLVEARWCREPRHRRGVLRGRYGGRVVDPGWRRLTGRLRAVLANARVLAARQEDASHFGREVVEAWEIAETSCRHPCLRAVVLLRRGAPRRLQRKLHSLDQVLTNGTRPAAPGGTTLGVRNGVAAILCARWLVHAAATEAANHRGWSPLRQLLHHLNLGLRRTQNRQGERSFAACRLRRRDVGDGGPLTRHGDARRAVSAELAVNWTRPGVSPPERP
mmetsp:Transcript_6251/g.17898  ORF Transcript_6251/g.17898 Transcript_6251/m.17898 type:complete len:306 (+) Transcript_6251:242-1159(+)